VMKMKGEEFKRNSQSVITLLSHVGQWIKHVICTCVYTYTYTHVHDIYLYAAIVQHIFLNNTTSIVHVIPLDSTWTLNSACNNHSSQNNLLLTYISRLQMLMINDYTDVLPGYAC
jgi:hypothetical protein